MARILLRSYCVFNPDNSFNKTSVYYETGQLAQQLEPIVEVAEVVISCPGYQLPAGTELERFCAVNANGAGVRRVITSGITLNLYNQTDTADTACDGTCDLLVVDSRGAATSSVSARDGVIRMDVSTSYPPLSVFHSALGRPTETLLISAAGVLPAYYVVRYTNLAAGNYVFAIQDNGNCQANTGAITVPAGTATGSSTVTLPAGSIWFKYELVVAKTRNDTSLIVQGYAWNTLTKSGYPVAPIPLTYPTFDANATLYNEGTYVKYFARYYRALADMVAINFYDNNYKVPNPTNTDYWDELPVLNKSTIWYDTPTSTTSYEKDYFYSPPATGNNNYWFYNEGTIVRYGWDGLYRAKHKIESRTSTGRIPEPTIGVSNNDWELLTDYNQFYYAVSETQVVDRYANGVQVRSVRYHSYRPDLAAYTPASSAYLPVVFGAVSPAQGLDFILFDDTTTAVETALGDLRILDIIKADIDEEGVENGSVAIIATSPSPPIRFHLRNVVRPGYVQDNLTGIYENLSPGHYQLDVYDADNRHEIAEFDILDEQRLRWRLIFDDTSANPLEVRIFQRNWDGAVTNVCGTGEPVILSWDTGGDPAGALPEAVGANLEFNVRTSIVQQFVAIIEKDDRHHRIDYYRNNILQFRGFIDATSYQEALLGAGQTVKLTATDGLGQLKNTAFVNHLRERQTGRTSMLSILLKCLSYTDVNLPLICGNNLRDVLMSADGEPLLEAYVNRNTYDKKDGKVIKDEDIVDARSVIDEILKVFHAMLFQADGCWKIIALNEVHEGFAVRVFSPAGARVTSGVDDTSAPLRILESQYATGARELFWINGTQVRTTVAAAQILKATVNLKLEENLLRNGNFTQWDGTNTRPLYWAIQGNPTIARAGGEKAKEYAVQFSNYTTTLTPANYLISPEAPHLTGQDEDGMVVKFKALLEHTTTNPDELTVALNFQVVCDGSPVGALIPVVISTKDKWKEQTINLPLGLPGTKVRVRMLAPVATDTPSLSTTLKVNYLALSIQPGLVDWSDQKDDFVEVLNDASVTTGIRLDDIELAHADLPLLPNFAGNPLPPKKMDVYAWRHAISLVDFSATTAWKRPNDPASAPLLDNAAQDRMALRAVPATEVTGEVKGPGINYLRIGLMLDMPEDLDGRFLVLNCFKNERAGTAQITVRKLADGDYGGVLPDLPSGVRIAKKNNKLGYRIAFVNGVEAYRVAQEYYANGAVNPGLLGG